MSVSDRAVAADGGRRIEFTGSSGAQLAARLDLPDTKPRAYALFARQHELHLQRR